MSAEKNTAAAKKNTNSTRASSTKASNSAKGSETGARRGRPPGSKNKNGTKKQPKLSPEEQAKIDKIIRRELRVQHLIMATILLAVSAFLIVAMFTELAGAIGRGISYTILGLFGAVGYVLPFYFLAFSILLIAGKASKKGRLPTVLFMTGFYVLIAAVYSIGQIGDASTVQFGWEWLRECFVNGVGGEGGGFIGMLMSFVLVKLIGKGGAYIITIACMLISAFVTMNKPFSFIIDTFRDFKQGREDSRVERLQNEINNAINVDSDEGATAEYQLDIHRYKEYENVQAVEKKKQGQGKWKSILSYLKTDDNAMFKPKDEMGDITVEDIPDIGLMDGQDRAQADISSAEHTEAQKPEAEAQKPEAAGPVYGLNGEDDIFFSTIMKNDKTKVQKPAEDNISSLKSPLKASLEDENKAKFRKMSEYADSLDEEDEKRAEKDLGKTDGNALNKETEQKSEDKDSSSLYSNHSEAQTAEVTTAGTAAGSIKNIPPKKEVMDKDELSKGIEEMSSELSQKASGKDGGAPASESTFEYKLPPISLLKGSNSSTAKTENIELSQKAALLEKTFQSFNVNAKVIKVSRGPSVTRFEVQPGPGVKVNRIVSLQDDIALNLEARSIRLEAPIPGKAAVGIEIENDTKKPVYLRDIIDSDEFKNSESRISFAVGRDISGNPIVANLKEMPHLLIAGSTGSGKSVCINSIILSLLYKAKPDEVKIIMVDPKVVELSNYNGIPHLMIPVVNDSSKAAVALNWAVKEMEERYNKFSENGVKDLNGYNRKAREREDLTVLPQIVIIIDELADLMMAAPQQVEDAICRLAQMARAAGMHLIVATQRPSVDVITGVIKANIPSRIAFAVSSQIDSRTILDSSGAEKLVGKGDMLFNPIGVSKPLRVQGNYVSEDEIAAVIDFVSNQEHQQEFSNDLMDTIETTRLDYDEEEVDELLRDAIELVVNAEQASTSMIQRKFRIGYNRAARLMDMMEERGIVGPADGSRPRRVLLSKAGLEELDNRAGSPVSEMDISEEEHDEETYYISDEYNVDSQAPDYEPDPEPEEE